MVFISFIKVLNVSIILMMTIAFSNYTFGFSPETKLYQLAELNNPKYDEYLKKEIDTNNEKKLNNTQFFESAHYFDTWFYTPRNYMDENTFGLMIKNECESKYNDSDYAVNQYYLEKFKETIEKLRTCIIVKDPDEVTDPDEVKNNANTSDILKDVHDALNSVRETWLIKKSIEAIDKKLKNSKEIEKFYNCYREFKNDMYNIKFEGGDYPKTHLNIYKELTEQQKELILEIEDIELLKNNSSIYKKTEDVQASDDQHGENHEPDDGYYLRLDREYNEDDRYYLMLNKYTGFIRRLESNHPSTDKCREHASLLASNSWKLLSNKLLQHFVFPSPSDTLEEYKNKRMILVDGLRMIDHSTKDKDVYIYFKHHISTINEDYFSRMKTCRALSNEDNYNHYVMRLVFLGCRPLSINEWSEEWHSTDLVDFIARKELKLRNVTSLQLTNDST